MTGLVMGDNGSRPTRFAKVFAFFRARSRSFQVRRLQAELGAYETELEARVPTAPAKDSTSAAISHDAFADTEGDCSADSGPDHH
jgi:hypothetical protein